MIFESIYQSRISGKHISSNEIYERQFIFKQSKQSEDKHRMSFKWCWQITEYPVYEMKLTPQRPDELQCDTATCH